MPRRVLPMLVLAAGLAAAGHAGPPPVPYGEVVDTIRSLAGKVSSRASSSFWSMSCGGFLLRAMVPRLCLQYGKGSTNNKKARYTEVPTPPCSKPTPFLLSTTARMISLGGSL